MNKIVDPELYRLVALANEAALNKTIKNPVVVPFKAESQISLTILIPTWPVIIVFGIFANLANIVVFLKAGIKDSVTTLLFSLALSDVTFLLFISPTAATYCIFHFAPAWNWPFHTNITFFLFYWPAFTVYDVSAYISISTGVMRCACVAMPLRFKSVFTKSRTVKLIPALIVLAVLLRMPVLTMFRLEWVWNHFSNRTEIAVLPSNKETLTQINDLLNRNSLPYIYFAIMIACVLILTIKLRQATRVRWSHTSHGQASSEKSVEDNSPSDGQKLSAKDIQVVQSVVLVCSIFIMSQLPFLLYSAARLIQPEFSDWGKYRHLFRACSTFSLTCSFLNASLNIFVYYRYNSRYREAFISMLPWGTASEQPAQKKP